MRPLGTRRIDPRLAYVVLAVVVVLAHARGLAGGFVYDDHRFIEHNAHIDHFQPAAWLLDARTASGVEGVEPDIYRPVRTGFFALQKEVFGTAPFGWHATSLLLFLAWALLLLRWLRSLVPEGPWACVAACVVAVHPACVEVVAWVSSQGDLLAALGTVGALLAWQGRGVVRTTGGAVLLAFALLAKESALPFPALALLAPALRTCRAGGVGLVGPSRREGLLRFALSVLLVFGYTALRANVMGGDWAQVQHPEGRPALSLAAFLAAVPLYLRWLVFPLGFPFETRLPIPPSPTSPAVLVGASLLFAIAAAGLWAWRRGRTRTAFALWGSLALLVPASQVFVPLKTIAAERFLFPLLLPIALGLALALSRLPRRVRMGHVLAAGAVAVLVLAAFSIRRTAAWADDERLWHAVRNDRPDSALAAYGLAFEAARRGDAAEALRSYTTWLEANPFDGKARAHAGDLEGELAVARPFGEARLAARARQMVHYREALSIWSRWGLARGRGGPDLREHVLAQLFAAALEVGDLDLARLALDQRVGVVAGSSVEDRAAVNAAAPWPLALDRLRVAWAALGGKPIEAVPDALWEGVRTRALEDAGLDPRLPDASLVAPWATAVADLLERRASDGSAPGPEPWRDLVDVLGASGHAEEAALVWRRARARYPNDYGEAPPALDGAR